MRLLQDCPKAACFQCSFFYCKQQNPIRFRYHLRFGDRYSDQIVTLSGKPNGIDCKQQNPIQFRYHLRFGDRYSDQIVTLSGKPNGIGLDLERPESRKKNAMIFFKIMTHFGGRNRPARLSKLVLKKRCFDYWGSFISRTMTAFWAWRRFSASSKISSA